MKNDAYKRINEDVPVGESYSKNLPCKTCAFQLERVGKFSRANNAFCHVYTKTNSSGKPKEILFKDADCKYYVNEDE